MLTQELSDLKRSFNQEQQRQSDTDSVPSGDDEVKPSGYQQLFIFAEKIDILLMTIAAIFSVANGVSIVFYSIPLGHLIEAFSGDKSKQQIAEAALLSMKGFLINSAVVFVNCWFMTAAWTITSERQMRKARKQYFEAILKQEQAWHDRFRPAELCEEMFVRIAKVHQALVTHMTSFLTKMSTGCSGIIISLMIGWKMAAVMISFLPVMILSGVIRGHFEKQKQFYLQHQKVRTDSDVIEIFDNIKTVKVLSGENYESQRYRKELLREERHLWSHGWKGALAFSFFLFCIITNYTLGFWFGAKLVSEGQYNWNSGRPYGVSEVIIIFFTLYISNLNFSGLPDNLTQLSVSRLSMAKILKIINRQPKIKYRDHLMPENIQCIELSNIDFGYDKPLFSSLNLRIGQGITALVGPSGCGKTTIISLIMRFYDPEQGSVIFHGKDNSALLHELSEQSLRTSIGYVGQEPVLIGDTLRQALLAEDQSDHFIHAALAAVKADQFVQQIGLDAPFTLLSGGQKQRIAIARALLKKPQILILDESTSALDRKTEQQVLLEISKLGIKHVIMIAHRPETLIRADTVIEMQTGRVISQGSFKDSKMAKSLKVMQQNNAQYQIEKKEEPVIINNLDKQMENQAQDFKDHKITDAMLESTEKSLLQEQEQPEAELQFDWGYITRLISLNKEYWHLYVVGVLGAIYFGCIFPFFSYFLSQIIIILIKITGVDQEQKNYYHDQVQAHSLTLILISLGSLLLTTARWLSFESLTCKIGTKLKQSAFQVAINKQYEQIEAEGAHCYSHIITKNCETLKPLVGNLMPIVIENLITLVMGLAIALFFSWIMTLVSFGILPLVLVSSRLMMSFNTGMQSNTDEVHKENHKTVVNSIVNIKTVRSCRLESKISEEYEQKLNRVVKLSIKYGNLGGIMFGIGQTLIFCMIALIFYIGALLVKADKISIPDMYISINAIMFAGVQAGGNLHFLTQLSPAKVAACRYFQLVDQNQHNELLSDSAIDNDEHRYDSGQWKGNLKFHNVGFKYSGRSQPLFEGLNLEVQQGQKVAIVGESGSGKSTIAALVFKLYRPNSGSISIDGVDIENIAPNVLSRISNLVMQEPVLFNRSVYENIKYNCKGVGLPQVIDSSKKSHAHDFIMEGKFGVSQRDQEGRQGCGDQLLGGDQLDQKTAQAYSRCVGSRGGNLSGGQKQRVAIARSIIREPKIMILDEATSALDTQNEQMIQETFDSLKHTTQVIIAHRLSTIRNCDKILVMHQGHIVEQGTFAELLENKGVFHKLVTNLQHKQVNKQ